MILYWLDYSQANTHVQGLWSGNETMAFGAAHAPWNRPDAPRKSGANSHWSGNNKDAKERTSEAL